jgi:hypothetical protein
MALGSYTDVPGYPEDEDDIKAVEESIAQIVAKEQKKLDEKVKKQ